MKKKTCPRACSAANFTGIFSRVQSSDRFSAGHQKTGQCDGETENLGTAHHSCPALADFDARSSFWRFRRNAAPKDALKPGPVGGKINELRHAML